MWIIFLVGYKSTFTFAVEIIFYLYMIAFREYDQSAYNVIVPGIRVNGLFVRQTSTRLGSELGNNYLLTFKEIGIEDENFECTSEVTAVERAKKRVKDRMNQIHNMVNHQE